MNSIRYQQIIKKIDDEKLNKIYINAEQKGFKVDGFIKLKSAPLFKICDALNKKKKQANMFLNEICKAYDIDKVVNRGNGKLIAEDIKGIINNYNKVGIVSALILDSSNESDEEEILELLNKDYCEKSFEEDIYDVLYGDFLQEGFQKNNNESESKYDINTENEQCFISNYICKFEKGRDEELFFIKPVLELKNNKLTEIDDVSIFGETGKMKISSPKNIKSRTINEYKYYTAKIDKNDIYIFNDDGEEKGQIYENKIIDMKELDENNIYEVIKLADGINIDEFKCRTDRVLKSVQWPVSNNILIESNKKLYGPFRWRIIDNGIEIILSSGNRGYVYEYMNDELIEYIFILPTERTYEDNKRLILKNSLFEGQPTFDFINDDALKDLFSKWIGTSRKDKNLIRNKLQEIDNIECTEERKRRIEKMFRSIDLVDDIKDDMIRNLLEDDEDSSNTEQLVNKVINNKNYYNKIEKKLYDESNFKKILKDIDDKRDERDRLIKEVEKLDKNMLDKLEEERKKNKDKLVEENAKLELLNEEIKSRIALLREEEGVTQDYIALKRRIMELKDEIKKLESERDYTNKYKNDLEDALDNVTSQIRKTIVNTPIDGMIAKKMLTVANEYDKNNNSIKVNICKRSDIREYYDKEREEFIDYIYELITKKAHRDNFTRNDIINILICISQGFLTIFAGKPGTGKTSLCEILGQVLGMYRKDENNRYIEISVEKGWTSKRDFIGYYNPLTKKFDKNNRKLFDAFATLDKEERVGVNDFPYLILLDEANLSSMEHYWADFMNVCDLNKKERCINLCEEYNFKVSKVLRFLATINYDHTTEVLSPRLLDRSWIILLDYINKDIGGFEDNDLDGNLPMVSYNSLVNTFGINDRMEKDEEIKSEFKKKLQEIYDLFLSVGAPISNRVLKAIKKYCIVGEGVFDDTENIYVSLDYAIAQKVLPLINGYGDGYKNFLIRLQEICDKSAMPKCNEIIKNIIKNGENNMQYYQFFV